MIPITTYQEMNEFVEAFGRGTLSTLVIVSRGGMGKSEQARRTLDESHVTLIPGHTTALGLYKLLFEGRDRPVVFEEIDGLLENTQIVGLLKQACENRPVKRIMWVSTDKRAIEIDGGVGSFTTTSKVMILCNKLPLLTANVSALATRAIIVQFNPPHREIMDKIRTFATDAEIIAFLERHYESIRGFNLRTYVVAAEIKASGLDWQRYITAETNVPPKAMEISELLDRFDNDIDRVAHYSASRRDYYKWKPEAMEFQRRRSLKPNENGTSPCTSKQCSGTP